jgi:pyrroloquinoline quinone biosynthesis protein D
LQRNPEIVWRVEKRREQDILQALERGEDVTSRGTVILIISGMMHQLNLVGGRIWTLCDGSRDEAQIVVELAQEFDAAHDEIAGDVADFVADLIERGWLIRV